MKSIKNTAVVFLLFFVLMHPLAAGAVELDDIKFENRYKALETGLELRGVGLLRYLGVFKAYAGAFYLEEGAPINQALADRAKRIEVEYFRS
ncbi:MAG: chalcone isomerase family protein, partial [Desulfobacterales bacterium]